MYRRQGGIDDPYKKIAWGLLFFREIFPSTPRLFGYNWAVLSIPSPKAVRLFHVDFLKLALVSVLSLTSCLHPTTADWPRVKKLIRGRFPEVPQLSTEELNQWLENPGQPRLLLIDARTPAEFAVSHLQEAQLAPSEEQALSLLKEVEKDRLIVVYCSVGYRSSALARQLMAHGFTKVYNLEGSIFEWANEGRPLYSGERRVYLVHPYNSTWGGLLDKKLWSTAPELSN